MVLNCGQFHRWHQTKPWRLKLQPATVNRNALVQFMFFFSLLVMRCHIFPMCSLEIQLAVLESCHVSQRQLTLTPAVHVFLSDLDLELAIGLVLPSIA